MLVNFLKPLIIFIPLAAIQLVVVPFISFQNMAPNLILILIVFYALVYGQIFGMLLGFVAGFFFDLFSGSVLGGFMFSFTLAGFIAGYFFNENKYEIHLASYVFSLIVLLCSVVSLFIYSIITNNNTDVRMVYQAVEDGLIPGIYTAVFSIPVVIFNPRKVKA